MPITTEVSRSPRGGDASPARRRVLIDVAVDVSSELLVVDMRSTLERREENLLADKLTSLIGT
jgi:hypothetical protein